MRKAGVLSNLFVAVLLAVAVIAQAQHVSPQLASDLVRLKVNGIAVVGSRLGCKECEHGPSAQLQHQPCQR